MKEYLTIQEAIRTTGTSDSTVRRWLKSLDTQSYKVNVKSEGRRLFIKRSFLIQSFKALNVEEVELTGSRKQGPDLQQLLNRQADQIDQLISENVRKDDEIKTAWNIILNLERETARLSGELKRLSSPAPAHNEDTANTAALFFMALTAFAALALVAYLVFS